MDLICALLRVEVFVVGFMACIMTGYLAAISVKPSLFRLGRFKIDWPLLHFTLMRFGVALIGLAQLYHVLHRTQNQQAPTLDSLWVGLVGYNLVFWPLLAILRHKEFTIHASAPSSHGSEFTD